MKRLLIKKKCFFFVVILMMCEMLFSQNMLNDSIIIWSNNYKLKVDDFQKESIIDFQKNKNVHIGGLCNYSLQPVYIESLSVYNIYVLFNQKGSYINVNGPINQLLEHEQLHFDIGELFARKVRQNLLNYYFKNDEFMSVDSMDVMIDDFINTLLLYQDKYDDEVDHSMNKEKQQEWNEKVKKELEALASYSYENYLKMVERL